MSNTLERIIAPEIRLMQVVRLPLKFASSAPPQNAAVRRSIRRGEPCDGNRVHRAGAAGIAYLKSMNEFMVSLAERLAWGCVASPMRSLRHSTGPRHGLAVLKSLPCIQAPVRLRILHQTKAAHAVTVRDREANP